MEDPRVQSVLPRVTWLALMEESEMAQEQLQLEESPWELQRLEESLAPPLLGVLQVWEELSIVWRCRRHGSSTFITRSHVHILQISSLDNTLRVIHRGPSSLGKTSSPQLYSFPSLLIGQAHLPFSPQH